MFKLSSFSHMHAVHRALVEAKFNLDPDDKDLSSSKFLAESVNQLYDEILIELKRTNMQQDYDLWANWRVLDKTRKEYHFIVEYIKRSERWDNFDSSIKGKIIDYCASPYILPDELKSVLLSQKSAKE